MVKKLSCVSHGSLKRFPHTFTSGNRQREAIHEYCCLAADCAIFSNHQSRQSDTAFGLV